MPFKECQEDIAVGPCVNFALIDGSVRAYAWYAPTSSILIQYVRYAVEESGERMAVLTTLVGLLELNHLQLEGEDGTGSLESDIELMEVSCSLWVLLGVILAALLQSTLMCSPPGMEYLCLMLLFFRRFLDAGANLVYHAQCMVLVCDIKGKVQGLWQYSCLDIPEAVAISQAVSQPYVTSDLMLFKNNVC